MSRPLKNKILAVALVFPLTVATLAAVDEIAEGSDVVSEPKSVREKLKSVLGNWFPSFDLMEPNSFSDDPSAIIAPNEALTDDQLARARPWREPDFAGQTTALGWSEGVFDRPDNFDARVDFWKDIYAKYSTQAGVLHDVKNIEIVYGSVDFSQIMENKNLSVREKARAREALVDQRRSEISTRLLRLHELAQSNPDMPEGLSLEEERIWKLFSKDPDPARFQAASEKLRIRFQLGQRDRFFLGIFHSGRYLRRMEKIFRDENMPIELTRLPFVESSFNINALSKVGASGIWQFMPRTAKAYMKVNLDVDERNDPLTATRAAARLLRENYQMLKRWPLAITGYNHGAYGVRSIVNKMGTSEINEIVGTYNSTTFGFASENFYACFVAALEVEREARKHFSNPRWAAEIEEGDIKTTRPLQWTQILEFFDGRSELAKMLNPAIQPRVHEGRSTLPSGVVIRVPLTRLTVAEEFMKGKVTPSELRARLETLPMPATLETATSVIDASKSALRERLLKPSEAANAVLPELTNE